MHVDTDTVSMYVYNNAGTVFFKFLKCPEAFHEGFVRDFAVSSAKVSLIVEH